MTINLLLARKSGKSLIAALSLYMLAWGPAEASDSAVVAKLEASRLSGPAPLAVQFDATQTTGGLYPFHRLFYAFDFGDDTGDSWSVDKAAKGGERGGPIAAHVFDRPGTYNVRVVATGDGGRASEATVTVLVQDPDIVYGGRRTVCVSAGKNFAGCPSGAEKRSSLPDSLDRRRVLLRRGEMFPAVTLAAEDKGFQIAAFGEGPKPTIEGLSSGATRDMTKWANDFTVMDLAVGIGAVSIEVTTSRFLLYRNDIKVPGGGEAMVNVGTALPYYHEHGSVATKAALYWPREIFIVGNDIQGVVSPEPRPNVVVMGYFYKSVLVGNTIDRANEHTLRIWAASKLLISHNRIGGNHYAPNPPGIRGAVKIHSSGTQAFSNSVAAGPQPMTNQVILSHNIIGSSTYPGSFLSGFSPQNADQGTVEGLEDCISENNVYVRGAYTVSDMQLRGRRMTARGNIVVGGKAASVTRSSAKYDSALDSWDGPYFIE